MGVPPAPPAPDIPLPAEPQSIEQTGLTLGFIADLALKTLYLRGQMTMAEISSALGLPIGGVTDKAMEFLKNERLVEIRGGTGLSAASYQFVIVDRGSEKAQEALARSQYVGKAPVPLQAYLEAVKRQTISNISVTQEELAHAFSHMVIPRETLGQLGPAEARATRRRTWTATRRQSATRSRSRCGRTAASSWSMSPAASACRRKTSSTGGWCRSRSASTTSRSTPRRSSRSRSTCSSSSR